MSDYIGPHNGMVLVLGGTDTCNIACRTPSQ